MSTQKKDDMDKSTRPVRQHPLRRNQELNNPCLKEHLQSLKCLDANSKDHKMCEMFFENYKTCKIFWSKVSSERKSKGITPHLPPVEERAKIKSDYLNSR